ncbi:hypothetical protein K227x_53810 [Rubripirellula lacrimiformis]|uniref:Uncharacterized protein n=1 Tax=Rubripirellula lacrimiformis TaxID=1930273 RepID=A0A517NIJ1_9BACT|nr:hypothetical protein [Rubripirellula lacrimiformis]QDT06957.1 hypothetical protein K227x_53810 [Rubripirellula lacrimiformis]
MYRVVLLAGSALRWGVCVTVATTWWASVSNLENNQPNRSQLQQSHERRPDPTSVDLAFASQRSHPAGAAFQPLPLIRQSL